MIKKSCMLLRIIMVAIPLTARVLSGTSGCMKSSAEGTVLNESELQISSEIQTENSKSLYEITPSDPEWKEMDFSEALDKTNLKTLDYENMSTEEVLSVCLDYPLLNEISCFDHYSRAVNAFGSRGKQFDVLYEREDAPLVLMESYRDYKQTATDAAEEVKDYCGKENFMFAMLRTLYEEERLSDEEFKEAEKLRRQHANDHRAFFGQETVPYDPDAEFVYLPCP